MLERSSRSPASLVNEAGERILVIGPSWVGDMVMAQSLFMTLKACRPSCVIDVMGPAWSTPILERMPEVRRALTLDVGHGKTGFRTRWRLGRQLRGEYDRAIILPRSWKSALVPFVAGVPSRTGFIGEQRFIVLSERRKLDKKVLDQTVKRFVSLGLSRAEAYPPRDIPQPQLRVDHANQARLIKAHGLPNRPVIGMMPGAEYGPSKQWPPAYFRLLAEMLIGDGYAVVVIGGPKDATSGETIAAGLEGAFNLCGKTSLADAVDLLGLCQQVVTNDSGLMHVAAAVGTRIQAVYGSTSPHYTPPLTDNAEIHWLSLACSPCFERTCPLGHNNCLNHIMPARLHQAIMRGASADSDVLVRQ